jgi:L-ascorbate metabolism protein UlaG (beta-lactamase superfamily)
MPLDNLEQRLQWLGHAGFRIDTPGGVVYIDPYRAPGGPPADVVLITHDHFDHFSRDDLQKLVSKRTRTVAPASVAEQVGGQSISIAPGESVELDRLEVTAVAAYNTNKVDTEGNPFHPREAGWVGYVLSFAGGKIYHSGDTDVIPEMDQAAGADVALLPVSGTYVMTAVEAAEAARRIEPNVAVPMHWGTLLGSRADAEEFARAAPVEVRIPEMAGDADGGQT